MHRQRVQDVVVRIGVVRDDVVPRLEGVLLEAEDLVVAHRRADEGEPDHRGNHHDEDEGRHLNGTASNGASPHGGAG